MLHGICPYIFMVGVIHFIAGFHGQASWFIFINLFSLSSLLQSHCPMFLPVSYIVSDIFTCSKTMFLHCTQSFTLNLFSINYSITSKAHIFKNCITKLFDCEINNTIAVMIKLHYLRNISKNIPWELLKST